jgi:hypothetical protein
MNFQSEPPKNDGSILASTEGAVNSAKTGISNLFSGFSKQAEAGVGASTEFLSSNTIVAKFAFIMLMVILFVLGLYIGMLMIGYIVSPKNNPYLVQGTIDGNAGLTVSQDPNLTGSVTILRSNNGNTGAEFTWMVWVRVDNIATSSTYKYSNVFNKGDAKYDSTTGIAVNNAPGLYIKNSMNSDTDAVQKYITLHVVMDDTASNAPPVIDISNIPFGAWTSVAIRLENTLVDVYVNGVITGRKVLSYVPKQNYYDVNICKNNGFIGKLSDLRYFSTALSVFDINNVVSAGPTLAASTNLVTTSNWPSKLSTAWYSNKISLN